MAVLLDTSVASLLHPAKRLLPLRRQYEPYIQGQLLAVSFQTVAELFHWAESRNWGPTQIGRLNQMLGELVVVPYDTPLAMAWAKTMLQASRQGNRLEAGDGWIAATAVHMQLPLLTLDRDFARLHIPGLQVICYA
jgi:tRNA(fMet)-specific endonuclease VapC